jgi:hypothetical protein
MRGGWRIRNRAHRLPRWMQPFTYMIGHNAGWIRLGRNGPGIAWCPSWVPLEFSESQGYTAYLVIRGLRLRRARSLKGLR